MIYLVMAISILLDALICFNFFVEQQGSLVSFVTWQILIAVSVIATVVISRKVKPN